MLNTTTNSNGNGNPDRSKEVIRLENVHFRRSQITILNNITLTINKGEHWAIFGPNGAGKSTLLSLFGAEKHPSTGTVHVLGSQMGTVDIRTLREQIGHVNPRHPLYSPRTVKQIVLTGATGTVELMHHWQPTPAINARADQLIALLGLEKRVEAKWQTLSQGERGRTLIARALMPDPPLLLLDEPSVGLDVAAREQFLTMLDDIHHQQPDLTTVMVTHHLEELPRTTTHALLLAEGKTVAAGKAVDVLTTQLVSQCFAYPIQIDVVDGRWAARAKR